MVGSDEVKPSKPHFLPRFILIGSLPMVLVGHLAGLLDLTCKNHGEGGVLAFVEGCLLPGR